MQYLKTERTHFMCPNMHFGMILELNKNFDNDLLNSVLQDLADAHPFLKSLIKYDNNENELFYNITNKSQIQVMICRGDSLWNDYNNISTQVWDVFEQGLLKIFVYPHENCVKLLFVFHHLLVDGKGAVQIIKEFSNDYMKNVKPLFVEEKLIQTKEDLPLKNNLGFISKILINKLNKQWIKEDKKISYKEYCKFIEKYSKDNLIEHKTYILEQEEFSDMVNLCHKNNFTINDLLMAKMYKQTKTGKIIIAADIRKFFGDYKEGSLGNFSTAMGITLKNRNGDIITTAKRIHKIVNKHKMNYNSLFLVLNCYFAMNPTLLDAAAISALGGFESKAATFVGKSMFNFNSHNAYCITNLGKIESNNISTLIFIPPASPAVHLILGVITVNGKMTACTSVNLKQ